MYSREVAVKVMQGFVGAILGDARHKYIVDTYNGFVSAGRSKGSKYKMTYKDPWCATTVSACAILANYTDIIPTECSCSRMIKLMKQMGIYQPKDDYIAKAGDIIFYKWDVATEAEDNGADGIANHVGMVESYNPTAKTFTVIEGNYDGKCQRRYNVKVGWKYIQGFGLPKYDDAPKKEEYYIVQKGDNLTRIAKKYGISVDELMALNPQIKNKNVIYVGQRIRVK